MDLQTDRMSRQGRCKKCKMTRLVIDTVNEMARKQGYKALKFLDRKNRPMLLNPIDTLLGVDAITNENLEELEQGDEEYLPLVKPESRKDEDSELNIDGDVDSSELADLMDEGEDPGQVANNDNMPEDVANDPDVDEESSNNDNPDQCGDDYDNNSDGDPRSLVLEPDARSTRERRAPERYDLVSGRSYNTVVRCHHLQTQRHPEERTFLYEKGEVHVVANVICDLRAKCHGHLLNL